MPLDAMPLTNVQRGYLAAADMLERDGWSHGRGHGSGGSRCLVVAIIDATDARDECLSALSSLLCRNLVDWNDEPGRTKEEVIKLLRSAAWSAS